MTTPSAPTAAAVDLPEIDGGAVRITAKPPTEQARVIVAYVGDQPITVPKRLPGNLVFNALRVYRRAGTTAMATWLVEEALGVDQTTVLSNCDGLETKDLKALIDKIGTLYQGQVDDVLGN